MLVTIALLQRQLELRTLPATIECGLGVSAQAIDRVIADIESGAALYDAGCANTHSEQSDRQIGLRHGYGDRHVESLVRCAVVLSDMLPS